MKDAITYLEKEQKREDDISLRHWWKKEYAPYNAARVRWNMLAYAISILKAANFNETQNDSES